MIKIVNKYKTRTVIIGVLSLVFVQCKSNSSSVEQDTLLQNSGTVVNDFPVQRLDTLIKHLGNARDHYKTKKYEKFNYSMRKARHFFQKPLAKKFYKSGLNQTTDGYCFYGRYSAVIKLALQYQAVKIKNNVFTSMVSDGNEKNKRRVMTLSASYKDASGLQKVAIPRCPKVKLRPSPSESQMALNFPAAVNCDGKWVYRIWNDQRMAECSPMNSCFVGRQSTMAFYLESEFGFDASDENWYEVTGQPDVNTIVYDFVDGPGESRQSGNQLKRCPSVEEGIYYGAIDRAPRLIQQQMEKYIKRELGDEYDPSASLQAYIDEGPIFVRPINFRGLEGQYTYLQTAMGDTEVGPIFKKDSLEMIGSNGDGDFSLYESVNGNTVWLSEE